MPLERLTKFFIEDALPVWSDVAFDAENGHFIEALQLDGTPERTGIVRTRTAARQIYVFAQASFLGVAPAGALEKAETAFRQLHAVAWIDGSSPGYARAFNRFTGAITDPVRDLYDHACVLLALAWLSKASGRPEYRAHIETTMDGIDRTLAAPSGGWAEDNLGTLPRRQNPHMHFLEACLALWETDGSARAVECAEKLIALFKKKFLASPTGPLREFFGSAWEVSADYQSERLDPGHMAEWVWLLRRYAKLSVNNEDLVCEHLLSTALAISTDSGNSFLVDEASLEGKALKQTRRLWPQAELLKACVMQYRATRHASYLQKAGSIEDELFISYLTHAPRGCWRDCFTLDCQFVAATIPASSLYHLWTLIPEVLSHHPNF